ncbi:MAG: DUF4129 domain-containing protein [Anaerolineae bacterium]
MGELALTGRRHLLIGMIALAEVAWAWPAALLLLAIFGAAGVPISVAASLAILLTAIYATRILSRGELSASRARLGLVAASATSSAVILGWDLYGISALRDPRWILDLLSVGALRTGGLLTPEAGALGVAAYFWWRGIRLGTGGFGPYAIGQLFTRGLLVLAGTALIGGIALGADTSPFVVLFFFAGLTAAALARVVRADEGKAARRPGTLWVAVPGATTGLLLLAAVASSYFVSTRTEFAVPAALRGAWDRILFYLLLPFGFLAELLLILFRDALSRLWGFFAQAMAGEGEAEPPPILEPTPPGFEAAMDVAAVVLRVLLFLVFVWIATRAWTRLRPGRAGSVSEVRESVASAGLLAQDLSGLASAAWERLVREWNRIADRVAAREDLTTVRGIYAALLRTAAALGFPRRPPQTPFEYLPTLRRVWPAEATSLAEITSGYVGYRYGSVPVPEADLGHMREALNRIRQRESERRESGEARAAQPGTDPGET